MRLPPLSSPLRHAFGAPQCRVAHAPGMGLDRRGNPTRHSLAGEE